MLPQSPLEAALWVGLVIIGGVMGYFGSTFEGKWRRRFNDERRFYAQYRDETDRLNIEKTRRIAELEAQKNALSQEVVRLRGDAAAVDRAVQSQHDVIAAPVEAPPTVQVEAKVDPLPDPVSDATPASDPEPAIEAAEPAPDSPPAPEVTAAIPAFEPVAPLPIMAASAITHPNILPHIETESEVSVPLVEGEVIEPAAIDKTAVEVPLIEGKTVEGEIVEGEIVEVSTAVTPPADVANADIDSDEPVAIDSTLDGLTRIRGIDATLAAGLGSLGVRRIEDIEQLSAEDEKAIEVQLNLPPGQIANQQWRLQAALIGSGEDGLIGG